MVLNWYLSWDTGWDNNRLVNVCIIKMNKLKLIYDFFRLWIKWGDRREAWQDAKFINDKKIQNELKEMDKSMKKYFEDLENGVH